MISHVALRSPFTIIKGVPSVILFSLHLLRRASFHDTSVLRIIIVHRHGGRVSIAMLLVIVVVIIMRHWRRHIVTIMIRIRWLRWISIVIIVWLMMMLPFLVWIHIRVLIWYCWTRILVILEWLILMIIVRTIELHPCVIGSCIGCWGGCSEPTWPKIAIVKLLIILTLTGMHSRSCCGRRTMISGITSVLAIFFLYKIQCCVLVLQIWQLYLSQRSLLFVFKSFSFILLEWCRGLFSTPHLLCSLWMV